MKIDSHSLPSEPPPKVVRSGKREPIYEREGKTFYNSEKPDFIIQEFSNGVEAGKKNSRIRQVSELRNDISSYLFWYMGSFGIPTHFVSKQTATSMVVKRLEMIPLAVRVYNSCNGALLKRLSLREGTVLDFPVIEHFYLNGKKAPSWVNEYHMYALNIVTPEELKEINRIASKVNAIVRGLCDRRNLFVADLQLAFGRFKNQIVLGDELSPVTCHFLDIMKEGKQDRDRFLPDQENTVEIFTELSHRLQLKV
jgi:phosphoribosylaminoimidazole-succinocarboxamide synthase